VAASISLSSPHSFSQRAAVGVAVTATVQPSAIIGSMSSRRTASTPPAEQHTRPSVRLLTRLPCIARRTP
jgi:hypothetical protein